MSRFVVFMMIGIMLMASCCTKHEVRESQPVTKTAAPVEQKQETYVASSKSCDVCNLVQLNHRLPKEASLGQDYECDVTLTALNAAGNILVITRVPEGARYVKSEPNATLDGNKLMWLFDKMGKDETAAIKIWFNAEREGDLTSCFLLSALPQWCGSTFVGKPGLAITKTAPAVAQLNEKITYTITVSNPGSAIARDVVVTDELPDGMVHESGQKVLSFQVGDLATGESKQIQVMVTATQRGRFVNVAKAVSSNAGTVNAEAPTVVQQHALTLTVTCDKESFLGKQAKSTVVLANPGDTKLTNVVVTATWAKELKILNSECQMQPTGEFQASWNVGDLEPNSEKTCGIGVISKFPGDHCISITVTCAEGVTKTEQCCTSWRGFPALLIEVVDDPDPLLIDEITTYTIRVTNQGTAPDNNIQIVVECPAELEAVAAEGSTQGTVEQKAARFAPYPTLNPKEAIQWTVKTKAVNRGDARLKVYLTSELLKNRVTEEEATQVY